jgi:primosomal replication protein N
MLPAAIAHHGWVAHYDRDQYVTVQGLVRDVQFVNPHAYVYIDTVDENGQPEVRWCEMQARTQLERRGVTRASFEIGGPITVSGFVSRQDPLGCETGTIHLPDGQVVVFRHRDGQSVYGAPQVAGDQSIFGSWYPKVFLAEAGSEEDSRVELTPEGIAAHEGFDWITQNPTLSCSPASNIRKAVRSFCITNLWTLFDASI